MPSATTLGKNPLVKIVGKPKEQGKLEQKHEPIFGVDVKQFSGTVTFVQRFTVKAGVKTNLSGAITYMACNDTLCLPPKTAKFSVRLE